MSIRAGGHGSIETYTILRFFPIIKGKNSVPPTLNVPFILRGKIVSPHTNLLGTVPLLLRGKIVSPYTKFSLYTKGKNSVPHTKFSLCMKGENSVPPH